MQHVCIAFALPMLKKWDGPKLTTPTLFVQASLLPSTAHQNEWVAAQHQSLGQACGLWTEGVPCFGQQACSS
jgi:hypothetical protein